MADGDQFSPENLGQRLGLEFVEPALLETALMHRSAASEGGVENNERLEFLGDAVLELISSEWLYRQRPDESEGLLTQRRSRLVSAVALAKIARRLGIAEMIRLSSGEQQTGGRDKRSVLANTVEAILGAIYLDSGLSTAAQWIEPHLAWLDESQIDEEVADPKNRLQEILQADGKPLPEYRTVAQDGPPHAPRFLVECWIEGERVASGSGASKRQAQRLAAEKSLKRIG